MKRLKELLSCICEFFRHGILGPVKYGKKGNDYEAELFWRDRLSRHGLDLRGVAFAAFSTAFNKKMYQKAKEVFLSLCRQERVDFKNVRILDIGCGNGFYARVFREKGGKQYLGIDITDVLFPQLKKEFPDFRFKKLDITTQEMVEEGKFDLVIMLDVTEHIMTHEKFAFAMENVKSSLREKGVFIVTSNLTDKPQRRSFSNIARPMSAYREAFPGYMFSEPVPFRDKFIFSIRKP